MTCWGINELLGPFHLCSFHSLCNMYSPQMLQYYHAPDLLCDGFHKNNKCLETRPLFKTGPQGKVIWGSSSRAFVHQLILCLRCISKQICKLISPNQLVSPHSLRLMWIHLGNQALLSDVLLILSKLCKSLLHNCEHNLNVQVLSPRSILVPDSCSATHTTTWFVQQGICAGVVP